MSLSSQLASCPLGIGTLQWGDTGLDNKMVRGGVISDQEVRDIVGELRRHGVKFFDTAEGYGGGTSELRLGEAIRAVYSEDEQRDLVLATKFLPTLWRFTSTQLLWAAEASRKRLGVDVIPLYFIHTPVHYRSVEFWINACCDAADRGIIKGIGVSNFNASQVERAVKTASARGYVISCNQIMFSLLDFNSTKLQETIRTCERLHVTVVAYSPIGQGLLTDNLTPEKFGTIRAAKMTRLKYDDIQSLRDQIRLVAEAHSKTMAQVCLNWTIAHGAIPLVGSRSTTQSSDSLGSVGWNLSEAEVKALDEKALSRSTLEGSKFKRGFFASLFGFVILAMKVVHCFSPSASMKRFSSRGTAASGEARKED